MRWALAAGVAALAVGVSSASPATTAVHRIHIKVPQPASGMQRFALYTIRIKVKAGAPRPKLKVRIGNLAKMSPDLRAGAARTKLVRSKNKRVWSFTFLAAFNNLAQPTADTPETGVDSADVIIEVFSGNGYDAERMFVDDCLTRAEQKAWAKFTKLIVLYWSLGPWQSTPAEIFQHVLEGEKVNCP